MFDFSPELLFKFHDHIVRFQPLFLKLILYISVKYFRSPRILFKNCLFKCFFQIALTDAKFHWSHMYIIFLHSEFSNVFSTCLPKQTLNLFHLEIVSEATVPTSNFCHFQFPHNQPDQTNH